MKTIECDVVVIGGGPGGYPAAIRAGQLGLKTVLVEAGRLGGTCLIRGCIPSKALIHAATKTHEARALADKPAPFGLSAPAPTFDMAEAIGWKNGIVGRLSTGVAGLLKAADVERIEGWATFEDAKTCTVSGGEADEVRIRAENVILATGSEEVELPFLPFDGTRILSSTQALDLKKVPERLAVVGAGYIGVELGSAFAKLGSKVTFIEQGGAILPSYDAELVRPVTSWLKAHGAEILLNTSAKGLASDASAAPLRVAAADGSESEVGADIILVAVGRRPVTKGWGLENMAVDMDGPFIKVDARCATAMKGVYAVGDVTGEPMLAHRATAMGEVAAENIAGHKRVFDPAGIAAVCFTEPEIAGIGLSPAEAEAAGIDVTVGKFPFAASGRAMSMEAAGSRGFIRVTSRRDDHVVVGLHAVGEHVAELSGEFALALEMGARLEDIAHTIHVHPTLSEATFESALSALGTPIHMAAR